MNSELKKVRDLFASTPGGIPGARQTERAIIVAFEQAGHRDASDQVSFLNHMRALDTVIYEALAIPALGPSDGGMARAYEKLAALAPERFWEKGLPKLVEKRSALWAETSAQAA